MAIEHRAIYILTVDSGSILFADDDLRFGLFAAGEDSLFAMCAHSLN